MRAVARHLDALVNASRASRQPMGSLQLIARAPRIDSCPDGGRLIPSKPCRNPADCKLAALTAPGLVSVDRRTSDDEARLRATVRLQGDAHGRHVKFAPHVQVQSGSYAAVVIRRFVLSP